MEREIKITINCSDCDNEAQKIIKAKNKELAEYEEKFTALLNQNKTLRKKLNDMLCTFNGKCSLKEVVSVNTKNCDGCFYFEFCPKCGAKLIKNEDMINCSRNECGWNNFKNFDTND